MTKVVRRLLDGKTYAVHGERPIIIAGIVMGVNDVLVTHPQGGGQFWLDGYEVEWFAGPQPPADVP
jgi:hypothetical protein